MGATERRIKDMPELVFSLVPPLLAITLALTTRRIILSLLGGVLVGIVCFGVSHQQSLFPYIVDAPFGVLLNKDHLRIFAFSLLMGSLICLLKRSGGIHVFLEWVSGNRIIESPLRASLFAYVMGVILFVEGSLSILTVGTVSKPLFEKYKMSREKLAYICDASCSPVAVLLPLNGWGTYLILQLKAQEIDNPVAVLISSMPYFFYPIAASIICLFVIFLKWNIGSMKLFEDKVTSLNEETANFETSKDGNRQSVTLFWMPIVMLIFTTLLTMIVTGRGSIVAGDGALSVLVAVVASLLTASILGLKNAAMTLEETLTCWIDGAKDLFGIVMILFLAFLLNQICKDLGTGTHLGNLLKESLPLQFIPVLVFLLSAFMAFATGTSWGTFAIMLSVAIPMCVTLGLSLPLVMGAVVSGGVWGDHCSPISDTTVLSALAADCDVMDHVRSQLPYAIIGGGISALLFLLIPG